MVDLRMILNMRSGGTIFPSTVIYKSCVRSRDKVSPASYLPDRRLFPRGDEFHRGVG